MMNKDSTELLLLIDIDSTISDTSHREHLLPDWKSFFEACDKDSVITPIYDTIKNYLDTHDYHKMDFIFLTGRNGTPAVIQKTKIWLDNLGLNGDRVNYRGVRDFSKSFMYKTKFANEYIKKNFNNPKLKVVIIDDDVSVVNAFNEAGHKGILVKTDNNWQDTVNEIKNTLDPLIYSHKLKNKP